MGHHHQLSRNPSNTYHFVPKGLDPEKTYKLTFDNTGGQRSWQGAHAEERAGDKTIASRGRSS